MKTKKIKAAPSATFSHAVFPMLVEWNVREREWKEESGKRAEIFRGNGSGGTHIKGARGRKGNIVPQIKGSDELAKRTNQRAALARFSTPTNICASALASSHHSFFALTAHAPSPTSQSYSALTSTTTPSKWLKSTALWLLPTTTCVRTRRRPTGTRFATLLLFRGLACCTRVVTALARSLSLSSSTIARLVSKLVLLPSLPHSLLLLHNVSCLYFF